MFTAKRKASGGGAAHTKEAHSGLRELDRDLIIAQKDARLAAS